TRKTNLGWRSRHRWQQSASESIGANGLQQRRRGVWSCWRF
ncbi:putative quinone oxidoreductase YhdH, partial [Vibrio parahaemolyticus VP2007-007]